MATTTITVWMFDNTWSNNDHHFVWLPTVLSSWMEEKSFLQICNSLSWSKLVSRTQSKGRMERVYNFLCYHKACDCLWIYLKVQRNKFIVHLDIFIWILSFPSILSNSLIHLITNMSFFFNPVTLINKFKAPLVHLFLAIFTISQW